MKTKTIDIEGKEYTLLRYKGKWVIPQIAAYVHGLGSPIYFGLLYLSKKRLEPYTDVTVNLPNQRRGTGCQFIDTNNNDESILDWLEENGFRERTGSYGHSGFCSYPEFDFYKGERFFEYKKLYEEPGAITD